MAYERLPASAWERNPLPLGDDLLRQISRLDRDRLEKLAAVAIDMLDIIDGDTDFEGDDADTENLDVDLEDDDPDHCVAGDDGMHPLIISGRIRWGSEFDID